jgi:hypothetical protein
MKASSPLPCYLCGRPVRTLGGIRWDGSGDPDGGHLTALHPICIECVADPDVRQLLLLPAGLEVSQ